MSKRSPILGYNHNVRHRGVVFHVQTEDSGVENPHLFTHLFSGGTIISSRKLDYDPGSAEGAIRSLMQSQHKAMLKGLKAGSFDEKIDRYLVGNPDLIPLADGSSPPPSESLPPPEAVASEEEPPPDSATTQEMDAVPEAIAVVDTAPGMEVSLVGEEGSDATIRIEVIEPGRRRGRDTLPSETDFAMPAISAPSLIITPPVPEEGRPSSQWAATTHAAPARAAGKAGTPRAAPATARPAPGSIEFRAPTGDYVKPARSADADAAAPRVEYRKPHQATEAEVSAAFKAIGLDEADAELAGTPAPPPSPASAEAASAEGAGPSVYIHTRTGRLTASPDTLADDPTKHQDPIPAVPSRAPAGKRGAPPMVPPPGKARRPAGDVVVSKPSAVIVGAPPKIVGAPARPLDPKIAPRRHAAGRNSLFGKDLISEKSLDEVILAYLSEDPDEK